MAVSSASTPATSRPAACESSNEKGHERRREFAQDVTTGAPKTEGKPDVSYDWSVNEAEGRDAAACAGSVNPSNTYQRFSRGPKVSQASADSAVMSVNLISGNQASQANEAAKPAAPKPQQTQQSSSAQPSDTVTLKSTGTSSQTGSNS